MSSGNFVQKQKKRVPRKKNTNKKQSSLAVNNDQWPSKYIAEKGYAPKSSSPPRVGDDINLVLDECAVLLDETRRTAPFTTPSPTLLVETPQSGSPMPPPPASYRSAEEWAQMYREIFAEKARMEAAFKVFKSRMLIALEELQLAMLQQRQQQRSMLSQLAEETHLEHEEVTW